MSVDSMLAFQAVNLATDFDFDQFYSDSLFAEITEELHKLAASGVDLYDTKNNSIIAEKVALQFDPNNTMAPDPTFILLVEIRKLGPDFVGFNYFSGESVLQPMKDFVSDAVKFAADTTISPLWEHLKAPLILAGIGLVLFNPITKAIFTVKKHTKG